MSRVHVAVCFYALVLAAFAGLTFAVIPERGNPAAPGEPVVHLEQMWPEWRARFAYQQGRMDVVINAYTEMIQTNPSPASYQNRAQAYEQVGRPERALADLNEAIRLEPAWIANRVHRARVYLRLKEYRKAIEDYEECSRQGVPDEVGVADDEIFYGRALAFFLAGEPEKAVGECTKFIAHTGPPVNRGRTCAAYRNRSTLHRITGKLKEAVADATEAVRLDPNEERNYVERAKAYLRSGLFANALADTDQAIRLPRCTEAVYDLRGRALLGVGKYNDALASFNQALEANPRADYYAHRSQAYQALGMTERAAKDAERAERIRQNAPAPAGPVIRKDASAPAAPAVRGLAGIGTWLDDTLCALDD